MNTRWTTLLLCLALCSLAPAAQRLVTRPTLCAISQAASDRLLVRRLACRDIARPVFSSSSISSQRRSRKPRANDAERSDLTQMLDRNVADGRGAVTSGRIDCAQADRQLPISSGRSPRAGFARRDRTASACRRPSVASSFSAATAATAPTAPVPVGPAVRGVTDREIRFGIAAPFSGSSKSLGRQMKLGIDTAFNRVNDAGGVEGRMLKLDRRRRRF